MKDVEIELLENEVKKLMKKDKLCPFLAIFCEHSEECKKFK